MCLFVSFFSACLLFCLLSVHLTGDLKLSASTDNSLRAGIDEATGKLSVRMREKLPLVSGTHVGFLCTHTSHSLVFTWAGAHWWLGVALVKNCRVEISPHPFHLFTVIPLPPPFCHLSPRKGFGCAAGVWSFPPASVSALQQRSVQLRFSCCLSAWRRSEERQRSKKIPLIESLSFFTQLPIKKPPDILEKIKMLLHFCRP